MWQGPGYFTTADTIFVSQTAVRIHGLAMFVVSIHCIVSSWPLQGDICATCHTQYRGEFHYGTEFLHNLMSSLFIYREAKVVCHPVDYNINTRASSRYTEAADWLIRAEDPPKGPSDKGYEACADSD